MCRSTKRACDECSRGSRRRHSQSSSAALKLFDDGGQPLLDRPFLKEILLSLQGRPEAKRTGKALLESFDEPPHGWPERAVKAGFGALLRARRLTARLTDGSVIRSETDPKAENWLTGTQAFNKSVLELSDLNITPDERKLLAKIFADVFDRPGLDTIEKLEKDGPAVLDVWLTNTRESLADLRGRQLPGADGVEALATVLQAATEPDLAAGKLKQLAAAGLKAGKDGDSLAALRAHVEVVQATSRLRSQNKLGLLADVRSRTTKLYPAWIAEGGGATVDRAFRGASRTSSERRSAAKASGRSRPRPSLLRGVRQGLRCPVPRTARARAASASAN